MMNVQAYFDSYRTRGRSTLRAGGSLHGGAYRPDEGMLPRRGRILQEGVRFLLQQSAMYAA